MLVNLDEDLGVLKGTLTVSAPRNNTLPCVSLTAGGNATSHSSGYSQVQTSDNMARFDANGNAICPPPQLQLLSYVGGGLSGGSSPAQPSSYYPPQPGGIAPNTTGGFTAPSQPNDFYVPNYVNGYSCVTCGAWVANGTLHVCGQFPHSTATITTFPRIEMRPHKCPVCEGKGQVPFNPAEPLSTDRDRTAWPCKPCTGSGVLWQ